MFNSISAAIEDLQRRGFSMVEIKKNGSIKVGEDAFESGEDLNLLECFTFEGGSDPDEEVNLFTLSTPKKTCGYLVVGFGEHIDGKHAKIANQLLRK